MVKVQGSVGAVNQRVYSIKTILHGKSNEENFSNVILF